MTIGNKVEVIAQMCHEVNRSWCNINGDKSQPAWEDAPQWQKDSAIAGVKFAIDNPDVTPEMSHESWSKQKIADGWVYGEVKDVNLKTHPCLIPYHELPEMQKSKDKLFLMTVKTMMR